MRALEPLVLVAFLAALVPLAGTAPGGPSLFALCCSLALAALGGSLALGADPVPGGRPAGAALAAFLLLTGLCAVALPQGLASLLSPSSGAYYASLPEPPASFPLSLCPHATRVQWLVFCSAAALFLACAALEERAAFRVGWWTFGILVAVAMLALAEASAGVGPFEAYEKLARGPTFGPFFNRNNFGAVAAMGVCLGVGAIAGRLSPGLVTALRDPASRWDLLRGPRVNGLLLLGAGTVLLAVSLLFTGSRSAMLGLFAGSCALGLLAPRFGGKRRRWAALLLAVGLGAAALQGGAVPYARYASVAGGGDPSDWAGRVEGWTAALRVARRFPLLGAGLGTFPEISSALAEGPARPLSHAENDLLQLAAETGLIGAALALAFLGLTLWRAAARRGRGSQKWSAQAAGAFAAAVAFLAACMLESNAYTPACLALAAMCLGLAQPRSTPLPASEIRRRPAGWAFGALSLGMGLAALRLTVPGSPGWMAAVPQASQPHEQYSAKAEDHAARARDLYDRPREAGAEWAGAYAEFGRAARAEPVRASHRAGLAVSARFLAALGPSSDFERLAREQAEAGLALSRADPTQANQLRALRANGATP